MVNFISDALGISDGLLAGILLVIVLIMVGFISLSAMTVVDARRGVTVGGGLLFNIGGNMGRGAREGYDPRTQSQTYGSGGVLLQEMRAPGITATMPSDLYF